MAEIATRRGGADLGRRGDEIICSFVDLGAAAESAAAMHESVAAPAAHERPMHLRIGFAHGPIIEDGDTAFGATVHLAARLAALAKAGQTLTTRETLQRLDPRWQRAARYYDRRLHPESPTLSGEGMLRLGGRDDEAASMVAYRCLSRVGSKA